MKTFKFSSWIFVMLFSTTLWGQGKLIPEDDIYFRRGDENPIVEKKHKEEKRANSSESGVLLISGAKHIDITSNERDIDEYNRRGGTPEYDESYADSISEPDSLAIGQDSFVDDDFEYAERIRRFHNPDMTIHITDPENTEIYILNGNDLNIVTDGDYRLYSPSWRNSYYWDYGWSPYYSYSPYWNSGWYGSYWGWGGWYDPWYYNGWYSPWNYGGLYSYGYYGYPYSYYSGYYGYYPHHYWGGHSNYGYKRYDNGRRPATNAYGSRDSRYTGRNSTRSSVGNSSGRYDNTRSSRYTTIPTTRSSSGSYNSSGTTGRRSDRYNQSTPAGNTVRSGNYTPRNSNRATYSTGSSSREQSRSNVNTRSSNYGSDNSTRSSSNSTPTYTPSNSGNSRSSGSYSSGGGGSRSSSGGGGRSSSGGGRR